MRSPPVSVVLLEQVHPGYLRGLRRLLLPYSVAVDWQRY